MKPLSGLPSSAVAEAARQFGAAWQHDQEIRIGRGSANTVVDAAMVGYYQPRGPQGSRVQSFIQETAWQETIGASAEDMGASLLSTRSTTSQSHAQAGESSRRLSPTAGAAKPPYRPGRPDHNARGSGCRA